MTASVEQQTARQIKRHLKRLGISQQRAARQIGKSPAIVSMVLNGRAKSAPVLRALSKLIAGNGRAA